MLFSSWLTMGTMPADRLTEAGRIRQPSSFALRRIVCVFTVSMVDYLRLLAPLQPHLRRLRLFGVLGSLCFDLLSFFLIPSERAQ